MIPWLLGGLGLGLFLLTPRADSASAPTNGGTPRSPSGGGGNGNMSNPPNNDPFRERPEYQQAFAGVPRGRTTRAAYRYPLG